MDVTLHVYDLSQGLARQFSQQFLGTQIDAIYHTSIVLEGIEYFFGAGIQTSLAGATHHGRPFEIIPMGKTELPMEIILEYLESLKAIYTPESYDLFPKNCNNFSNDFSMFLVGKEIPPHITALPQTVLNTPFGQMLQPQLDRAFRSVTQAPLPTQASPPLSRKTSTVDPFQESHPHRKLKVSKLLNTSSKSVTYSKVPPLDKLAAKISDEEKRPIFSAMIDFVKYAQGPVSQQRRLPSLPDFAAWMGSTITTLPADQLFAAYDLFRLALVDQRVSAYFAEEHPSSTVLKLVQHLDSLGQSAAYSLRIVTLHMACNFISSALAGVVVCSQTPVAKELIKLVNTSLLDEEHTNVRIAASSLAFNISAANHRSRMEKGHDALSNEEQVELLALVLEALSREQSKEACKGLVMALGLLVYCAPVDGELLDLCKVMDAANIVSSKDVLAEDGITKEISKELLGKGLQISDQSV